MSGARRSRGTTCGPDDTYRLRFYDTTGVITRFNNASLQVTVLVLQNVRSTPVLGNLDFWDSAGHRIGTRAFSMAPRDTFVLNTTTVPGLAGTSGSVTVSHTGGYGGIVGKAVALEPPTGFSFDTPLLYRPR